jgi:peptidyl-prolyl cis-trans isomerase B (cyclophilin B)
MVSKAIRCALFGAALSMLVAGAASADDAVTKAPAAKAAAKPAAKAVKAAPKAAADEVAVLETSKGRMVAEFWEKDAPKTVANFKKLARQGFFDGTGFHRIIKGFMIQGGDPNSKNPNASNLGSGGPGYTIADEFNSHPHVKGVLSMANTGTPNSAGSQFFVMHGTASSLDGHYTAFGHLIAGMDVLDKIANSQTGPNPSMPGENSKPIDWTTLKSVKIMPRNAWQATANAPAKKAEASKPAEGKATEMKSSMGGGTGMDMKAAGSTPATSSAPATSSSTGHPGHDTVEKAKEATQPAAGGETGNGGTSGDESGK